MRTFVIATAFVLSAGMSSAGTVAWAQDMDLSATTVADGPSALFTGVANKTRTIEQSKPTETSKSRLEAPKRLEVPKGRVCFNATETRDKIGAHHLTEPFRALRASRLQGEALKVRLCRWKPDDFVYEVSVLRRDGRVVRVYMNAANGQSLGSTNDGDRK